MNNIQKSFKAKGLRAGGKYADGFVGQAQTALRGRHAQIAAAVNGAMRPVATIPLAPTAAPAPASSKSYEQLDADIAAARAKMNKPKNFLGFADGRVPNLAGIGGVIPGKDSEQKDNVEVKVSAEEGILPRRSMKELQGILAEATGESIPQFIERTNGRPPAGLKAAGGKYAVGATGRDPLKLGWNTQEEFDADPMVQAGLMGPGTVRSVVGNAASKAVGAGKGLWQGAKKLFAGGGDDAAQAAAPNSVKAGYSRDAAGVITQNSAPASALRASVNKHPILAGGAALAAGIPAYKSAFSSGDEQQQAPALNPQATAQAQAKADEEQALLQAARVKLGLSPHEGGDVYSPQERAAITQGQGEWLGRNGINAEDQAQPAQSYQQASMNSRQTGGKNGLEAGKNYKLQYGPNSQIYGRSDRADGKINNFTGIGDGTKWEDRPENRQNHQEALQRAAQQKAGLQESIMARASSGNREDYNFALQQAAGLGMTGAVQEAHQQAGLKAAAMAKDPAGVYKQQMVSEGVAGERALSRQALAQDRAEKLQVRKDALDLQRGTAAGAAQQRKDERGDKTYERRIQELKAKNTVNGELDTEAFNKDFEFMRRGLAESGNGLEDADNEVFDSQLDKARIANAPQTWDWLKSFTGMNDPAVNTAQDAVIDHYESSPFGRVAVLKNGATRRVSDIQGGGVGPWASPVDSSQVRRDKRDLRYGQGGS